MKLSHLVIPLIVFLIPLSLAATGYDYHENADHYDIYEYDGGPLSNETGALISTYDIDEDTIFDSLWQVRASNPATTINITIPSYCYSSDNVTLRLRSNRFNDGAWNSSMQYQCYANGYWTNVYPTRSMATSSISHTAEVGSGVTHDGDYSTYAVWASNRWETCTGDSCTYRRIYEEAFYEHVGESYDVIWNIKNEFGKAIEGANVTAYRINDSRLISTKTTDLAGKVKWKMNDEYLYQINVSADGYGNFSGIVNVLETSYTITLTRIFDSSTWYQSVFENISFVTSPGDYPNASLTNFSLQINDTSNHLDLWGVYSNFNGTLYNDTNNAPGGGLALITVNLTNHTGDTISVYYFFKLINYTEYYLINIPFIIGGINASSTSLTGINDDFTSTTTPVGRALLGTFIIILLVAGLAGSGLPGDWAAAIAIPGFVAGGITGWFDPIISSMSVLLLIGYLVVSNRGGIG